MQYSLKLLGNLRQYLPVQGKFNHCQLPLSPGLLVSQALAQLNLPADKPYFVILNDTKLDPVAYATTRLKHRDELVLFPPIKGG